MKMMMACILMMFMGMVAKWTSLTPTPPPPPHPTPPHPPNQGSLKPAETCQNPIEPVPSRFQEERRNGRLSPGRSLRRGLCPGLGWAGIMRLVAEGFCRGTIHRSSARFYRSSKRVLRPLVGFGLWENGVLAVGSGGAVSWV